jgi:hypothetical protein
VYSSVVLYYTELYCTDLCGSNICVTPLVASCKLQFLYDTRSLATVGIVLIGSTGNGEKFKRFLIYGSLASVLREGGSVLQ